MSQPPSVTARRPGKLAQLVGLARTGEHRSTRLFAAAELGCIVLFWVTLAALAVSMMLRGLGWRLPAAWSSYVLPILCTGAVGYGTNYVAILMLFKPYDPDHFHWLNLLGWRQGLIPARKDALGDATGREIADKLLTPQAISDEITLVLGRVLDDEKFRGEIRYILGPILREHLPEIINRLTPEILSLMRSGLSAGFRREHLREFVERVVEPWLTTPESRDRLVDALVAFLRGQAPRLAGYLRDAADRYRSRGFLKRVFLGVAEWAGALDWAEVRLAVEEQVGSRENRERLVNVVADLGGYLRRAAAETELRPVLERFKERTSDYLGVRVEEFLTDRLPEIANRLVDTPAFWHWLAEEGIPKMKPPLMEWLARDGVEVLGKRFDVVGRVRSAVAQMDVRTLHEMADNVATEQLSAIQVLGFVLGVLAGGLLVLVL